MNRPANNGRKARSRSAKMIGNSHPIKPVFNQEDVSEDAIASAFTEQFKDSLKFDHDDGCWYEWDGTRWRKDALQRAFHYARELGRTLGAGKRAICKASVASGAERFARADPAHAVQSGQWDADTMSLGTPGGTVDLRTGVIRPPSPNELITKQTTATPENANPELWLQFLAEALSNDDDAIRFLQQWFGYCLTGETREHALVFAYGPGGNGKSVFLNTLSAILGDYASTAAMETFTASSFDRHPTELAMLRGSRLVTALETEEGRPWAEARVKAMTGGDPVTARFMRKDHFTFTPQFKLTLAGNHAPQLKNCDAAMRRRFNIVPFTTTPASPDRLLEVKLRAEHPRILAWGIAGCRDWQENGLLRPQVVSDATSDYFDEQDVFGQWISERCTIANCEWDIPSLLFNDWRQFANTSGSHVGTMATFSSRLQRNGFKKAKSNGVRIYRGLCVRSEYRLPG